MITIRLIINPKGYNISRPLWTCSNCASPPLTPMCLSFLPGIPCSLIKLLRPVAAWNPENIINSSHYNQLLMLLTDVWTILFLLCLGIYTHGYGACLSFTSSFRHTLTGNQEKGCMFQDLLSKPIALKWQQSNIQHKLLPSSSRTKTYCKLPCCLLDSLNLALKSSLTLNIVNIRAQ